MMRVLARAAILSALTCLFAHADASAQVGRRVGSRGEIAVPVEVPTAPPEVNRPADPAEGEVVKCDCDRTTAGAKVADGATTADAAPAEEVFRGTEVDAKAAISSVPEPLYTREARYNGTSGTVALRLTLHSTGKVSEVKVLRGLPDGLTGNAIDTACRVEFTPARKDGRAVSQYVTLAFNFETDYRDPAESRLPPPRGRRLPPGTRVPMPPPRMPRIPYP